MRLHAAGSLRPALTDLGRAFTAAHGTRVDAQFGSSGLLRERLDGGEAGDVYASADMGNPLALAKAGKALKLTGASDSPRPPDGRSVYAWHVGEGRADMFLACCTAGREAAAEAPGLGVVELPPELAVGAEYGLTVLRTANTQAALPFVLYILSAEGQAILARHGFDAPLLPR